MSKKRRYWLPRDAKMPDGTEIKIFMDGAAYFEGRSGGWMRVGQHRHADGTRIRMSKKDRKRLAIKKVKMTPQKFAAQGLKAPAPNLSEVPTIPASPTEIPEQTP